MNSLNLQAVVNNVPIVDRVSQDIHRLPIAQQQQNAAMASDQVTRSMQMPNQADASRGKKVDPDDRKQQKQTLKKKQKQAKNGTAGCNRLAPNNPNSGHIVDVNA